MKWARREIPGPAGVAGPQGEQGKDGRQGPRGFGGASLPQFEIRGYIHSVVRVIVYDSGQHGSGFYIDDQGTVLTAHHVVEGYDAVEVHSLVGAASYKVSSRLESLDLAILTPSIGVIPSQGLQVASEVIIGDEIWVMGFPLESTNLIVSKGVISGFHSAHSNLIAIDATIGPGSSGGPAITTSGDVIGVVFWADPDGAYGYIVDVRGIYLDTTPIPTAIPPTAIPAATAMPAHRP